MDGSDASDRPRGETGEQMSKMMQALPMRQRRQLVLSTVLRSVAVVALIVVVYYVLPLDRPLGVVITIWAIGGTLVLLATVAVQIRAIRMASYPVLRAIEAVALAVPLLVTIFASTYVLLSEADAGAFTEPLGRTDALYFTMVTLATIGFGDIAAVSETARVAVMVQIVANVAVLGVALKLIVGVARVSARRAAAEP